MQQNKCNYCNKLMDIKNISGSYYDVCPRCKHKQMHYTPINTKDLK